MVTPSVSDVKYKISFQLCWGYMVAIPPPPPPTPPHQGENISSDHLAMVRNSVIRWLQVPNLVQ